MGIYLLDLTSRANHWLSVRQTTIAENIANANTPGFKAQDVKPFESVLDSMNLAMASTRPDHLQYTPPAYGRTEVAPDEDGEVVHSGNSVSMETEMIKAGEVNRSFALNTSILKSFHRMLLASTKG
ncbi:MAG: flagellar basal body rod protein FlgB [Bacteroidota bacterium]|jgi:flagellar basal-body rod protein FlgB|nr:flagellar basal body rod protein FlgB [Hyphomicrobiaceae bacterium]